MQTRLADFLHGTAQGEEAEAILRSCVHCGFCNATCPTYQLLGDELDGPRGRIYLIKQMLEGQPAGDVTRRHLDRCLTCRNCETTCPSGVQYGRLIDIGREVMEKLSPRPLPERLLRAGLRSGLTAPGLFAPLFKLGQGMRGMLPGALREHIPPANPGVKRFGDRDSPSPSRGEGRGGGGTADSSTPSAQTQPAHPLPNPSPLKGAGLEGAHAPDGVRDAGGFSPSPLRGEGRGGGGTADSSQASAQAQPAHPHPNPSPLKGAGLEGGRSGRRRMLVLNGCVQPVLSPETNAAATRVLARLGIELFAAPGAGCCGAIDHHLAAPQAARAAMRRNIDAWWPHVEAGVEAIVMTASGCGSLVKDYGHLLRDDPAYADKAARVSALTRDLGEILAREDLSGLRAGPPRRVAFHPPCSLQHGQRVRGVIEGILAGLGHELLAVDEAHLCCGSAGTYSLTQPELAGRLRERKLAHLNARGPELIATANIGCQSHLAAASGVPVVHWISLLDSV